MTESGGSVVVCGRMVCGGVLWCFVVCVSIVVCGSVWLGVVMSGGVLTC